MYLYTSIALNEMKWNEMKWLSARKKDSAIRLRVEKYNRVVNIYVRQLFAKAKIQ
jgi:hypothetical protein